MATTVISGSLSLLERRRRKNDDNGKQAVYDIHSSEIQGKIIIDMVNGAISRHQRKNNWRTE